MFWTYLTIIDSENAQKVTPWIHL